jgi:hypothetical protein
MHRNRGIIGMALATAALLAACADAGTGTGGGIEGTYRAETLDGHPLPYTVTDGDFGFTLRSIQLALQAGGACQIDFVGVDVYRGQSTPDELHSACSYSSGSSAVEVSIAGEDEPLSFEWAGQPGSSLRFDVSGDGNYAVLKRK